MLDFKESTEISWKYCVKSKNVSENFFTSRGK